MSWRMAWPKALNGKAILVVDTTSERVPSEVAALTRYTPDEVALLEGATEDELRAAHALKTTFDGRLVGLKETT